MLGHSGGQATGTAEVLVAAVPGHATILAATMAFFAAATSMLASEVVVFRGRQHPGDEG